MTRPHITTDLAQAILADDPSTITPTFDAPWNATLRSLIQMFQGSALYVLVGLLIAAAVGWVGSKIVQSGTGQKISVIVMLVCGASAIIVSAAGGLIWWFAGIKMF